MLLGSLFSNRQDNRTRPSTPRLGHVSLLPFQLHIKAAHSALNIFCISIHKHRLKAQLNIFDRTFAPTDTNDLHHDFSTCRRAAQPQQVCSSKPIHLHNAQSSQTQSKVHQGLPPLIPMIEAARQAGLETAIILSCSDPRLNPYAIFGIDPSIRGISMVRNAGGRAMDAIRSISVLQTIASAKTLVVLHHTGEQTTTSNCPLNEV